MGDGIVSYSELRDPRVEGLTVDERRALGQPGSMSMPTPGATPTPRGNPPQGWGAEK